MSAILCVIFTFVTFQEVTSNSDLCNEITLNSIESLATHYILKTDDQMFSTIDIITKGVDGSKQKFVWDLEKNLFGKPINLSPTHTMPLARVVFPQFSENFCTELSNPSNDCQQLMKLSSKTLTFIRKLNEFTYSFKKIDDYSEEEVSSLELPFNMQPIGNLKSNSTFKLWPQKWIESPQPVVVYDVYWDEIVFISTPITTSSIDKRTTIWTNSIKSDNWAEGWKQMQINEKIIDFKGLVTILRGKIVDPNLQGIYGFEYNTQNIFKYNRSLTKTDRTYKQFFDCKEQPSNKVIVFVLVISIILLGLIPICVAIYMFQKKSKGPQMEKKRESTKSDNTTSVETPVSSVKTINSQSGKPLAPQKAKRIKKPLK